MVYSDVKYQRHPSDESYRLLINYLTNHVPSSSKIASNIPQLIISYDITYEVYQLPKNITDIISFSNTYNVSSIILYDVWPFHWAMKDYKYLLTNNDNIQVITLKNNGDKIYILKIIKQAQG
jgi:hypothetical protein